MSEQCQALRVGYKQCRKRAHEKWCVTLLSVDGPVKAEKVVVWLCSEHAGWPKDKHKHD